MRCHGGVSRGVFGGLGLAGLGRRGDDGAGDLVLGFPAVLLLAGDQEDLLAGPGLAKPGGVLGGDIALAVDGGGEVGGVRPSSGAAMLDSNGDAMKSGASSDSVLAAPEDGRTPPRHSPAVTDPLPFCMPCAPRKRQTAFGALPITNRRYGRLKTCATLSLALAMSFHP